MNCNCDVMVLQKYYVIFAECKVVHIQSVGYLYTGLLITFCTSVKNSIKHFL